MQSNLQIPTKLTPVFTNLQTNAYDVIVMEGGRGGAKSNALAAVGVQESFVDDGVILCCREIQKSISDSLYSAILSEIKARGLTSYFEVTKTEIVNRYTGARFIFAGLKHNITSVKSINKLRVVLTDEAENISQESWDYLRPTPRYGNVRTYVVFNPRFESDPTWQEFVVKKDDTTLHITINWQDNPWFPASLNRQRLRDAKGDAARYSWIWEGKFLAVTESSILGRKLTSRHFDLDDSYGTPYIGVDWGFSVDPTACIEAYIKGESLYIRNAASKIGLELDDTAAWLLAHIPLMKKYTSRADSARPETISKVKKDIPLMQACRKWAGSVEDGVTQLLAFDEIVVHPDAMVCYSELTAFSYKVDRHDQLTSAILDADNHYADALRYAIEPMVGGRAKRSYGTAGTRTFGT